MVRSHGRSFSAAPAVSDSASAYSGRSPHLPNLAALPPKQQCRDPSAPDAKSQADFLRGRGDLRHARLNFQAQLPKVSNSQSKASPLDRLGLRVQRSGRCLSVKEVADELNERNTPIVQYNIYQDRVRQPLYKIAAGDKIKRVNHIEVGSDMMSEMKKAVQDESELQLAVERELQDVLQAAPTHPQHSNIDALPMLPPSPAHTFKYVGSPKEGHGRRSRLGESSSPSLLPSPVGLGMRIDLSSSPVQSPKGEDSATAADATAPALPPLPPKLRAREESEGKLLPANSSTSSRSALKKPLSWSQASTREPTPDRGVRFFQPIAAEIPLA